MMRAMATGGCIGGLGDLLMQGIEASRERTARTARASVGADSARLAAGADGARTVRVAAYRMLQAPILEAAWGRFDVWFARLSRPAAVICKVGADQSILMPPFVLCFFAMQAALEGLSPTECAARARAQFVPAVCACVPFWCTAHLITFNLPARLRIAWASCAAVGWNAYLSHKNQTARRAEAGDQRQRGPCDGGGADADGGDASCVKRN